MLDRAVPVQSEGRCECLIAFHALEPSDVISLHMRSQTTGAFKTGDAKRAIKLFSIDMGYQVVFQLARVSDGDRAVLAFVRRFLVKGALGQKGAVE